MIYLLILLRLYNIFFSSLSPKKLYYNFGQVKNQL